jgi:hypothetical protein
MSFKIKIVLAALLLGGFLLLRRKKPATDKDISNYTPNQAIARKQALKIKSALNVSTSLWGWSEDEDAVIKVLNDNYAIQNLIAIEYKKLTQNVLFDDLGKYLTVDEIAKINFNKI